MAVCKKCEREVLLTRDGCKCTDCQTVYHIACVADSFKKRGSRTSWKCDDCAFDCSSTGSKSSVSADRDQGQAAVLEAIATLRAEINQRWDGNDIKLDQMREDINGIKSEINLVKSELQSVEAKVNCTEQSMEGLLSNYKRLGEDLVAVKSELLDLQQHSRKNNIIISGLPGSLRGSDVIEVIKKIASILDVPFYRSDINAAHWLPSRQGEDKSKQLNIQPLIVSFVSRIVKNDWIDARWRRRSLKACELDSGFPSNEIYINEQLTPHFRTMFNAARALLKEQKLSSVWTRDGRVLVKKTANSRPFRVTSLQDLDRLTPPPDSSPAFAPPRPTAATDTSK